MEKLALCYVCCLMASSPVAPCLAINITWSESTITGSWHESWLDADGVQHDTSGFGMRSAPYGWAEANAAIDSFNLAMTAYGYPWDTGTPDGGRCISSGITASASAWTRFTMEGTQLGLTLTSRAFWDSDMQQDMAVTLKDITAATTLLRLTDLDREDRTHEYFQFEVDPSHEYELDLSGWAVAWDGKYVDMSLHVALTEFSPPVPESCSGLIAVTLLAIPLLSLHRPEGHS